MKNKKQFTRKSAWLLAMVMVLSVILPLMISDAARADSIVYTKDADPSTLDSWEIVFGETQTTSAYTGTIWTDKSVFTDAASLDSALEMSTNISAQDDDFLVALSAMSANKSITGFTHLPTDTMLILDVSGSMFNSKSADELVTATNSAIRQLQAVNEHNRVGVVLYSGNTSLGNSNTGTATVLLPLDRYTQTDNRGNVIHNYLAVNNDGNYVSVGSNVKNADGDTIRQNGKNVAGGTYIQNGIYQAMDQMLDADPIIQDGPQRGTTRIPIMVLMSDGAPTAGNSVYAGNAQGNMGTSNMGNGTETTEGDNGNKYLTEIAFVTQLTAAYAKERIDDHYAATTPLFYTLGLGINESNTNAHSVLEPEESSNAINTYWNSLMTRGSVTLRGTHSVTLSSSAVDGQNQISRASQQYYVNKAYTADTSAQLNDVFASIVDEIILQSRYLPTEIGESQNYSGYITFDDEIGEYMNVDAIHGMIIDDVFFNGASFAAKFATEQTALDFFGTADNPSAIGNEFIYAVKERIGIDGPVARNLISHAYQYGQLYYNNENDFSNSFCWYTDKDGNYLGFYDESFPEAAPPNAKYICEGYGYLDTTAVDGSTAQGNLLYCSVRVQTEITVENGRITDRGATTLLWRIPASMIPMVNYEFTLENDTLENPGEITMKSNVHEASPIRLIYEVGLDDAINENTVTSIVDDSHKQADGSYVFYSNRWDADHLTDNSVNTTADFHPSAANERFHFTEDSTIYVQNGSSYAVYSGNIAPNADDATYYARTAVFDWSDKDNIKLQFVYRPLTNQVLSYAQYDADTKEWYIPLGTHRDVVRYTATKDANNTDTLPSYFYSPEASADRQAHHMYTIMGNNGRLVYHPSQGIKITKHVSVHVPGTDPSFEYVITRTDEADDNNTYRFIFTNASGVSSVGTITFEDSQATFFLKNGESAYLLDLPKDASYSIREEGHDGYSLAGITVDGKAMTGLITQDTAAELTIAQYQLHDVVFDNAMDTDGALTIRKIVEHPFGAGYQLPEDLSFDFEVDLGSRYANQSMDVYLSSASAIQTFPANADGVLTLSLKHGESATIVRLDAGTAVTVTEVGLEELVGFTVAPQARQNAVIPANDYAALTFTNTYAAGEVNPVNLTVNGVKNLIGRDWMEGDTFTFVLEAHVVDGDAFVWKQIDQQDVTYSENADYDLFSFTAAMQAQVYTEPGVYAYRLRELEGSIGGISYDPVLSYFDVIVGDADMDGKLEIQDVIGYRDITVTEPSATDSNYNVNVHFNNTYAAAGAVSLDININKTLEDLSGQNMTAEGFTFALHNPDGSVIKESEATSAAGETSIRLVFNETDIGKTYIYMLKEINNGVAGMTYDSAAYTLQVSILDNMDGTLRVEVSDENNNQIGTAQENNAVVEAAFENTYDPKDATFTIFGDKDLNGRAMTAGEFSFLLYETDADFSIAEDAQPLQTTTNSDAEGAFAFDTITKTEVGTYHYVVAEDDSAALGGVTYDQTLYYVTVVVEDHDGELKADVTITKQDGTEAALKFVNSYAPKAVQVTVNGKKVLNGAALKANAFTFALYNADSNFDTVGAAIRTAKNTENGSFAFPVLEIAQAGTYYFVAAEDVSDPIENIVYDTQVYHLTLTAEDNGDGTLSTTLIIETAQGKTAEEIVFTNTYTPPQEPPKEEPPAEEPKDDPPKTGDNMSVALWMLVSATMIALLAAAAVLPRRARSK